jgi:hypothetical protein
VFERLWFVGVQPGTKLLVSSFDHEYSSVQSSNLPVNIKGTLHVSMGIN